MSNSKCFPATMKLFPPVFNMKGLINSDLDYN